MKIPVAYCPQCKEDVPLTGILKEGKEPLIYRCYECKTEITEWREEDEAWLWSVVGMGEGKP